MIVTNDRYSAAETQNASPINPMRTTIRGGFGSALKEQSVAEKSFGAVLQETIAGARKEGVSFSKHAHTRLAARAINFSDNQMRRIEDGVLRAQQKGVRDSLVIVDDVALVVNVQNKVVITALAKGRGDGEVFTNIDGAVIV